MPSRRTLPRRISHRLAVELRARRHQDTKAYEITPDQAVADGADDTDIGRAFFRTSRPVWKWRHYFEAYEAELGSFRGTPVKMLEIGVFKGGSLQMWRDYLGPDAEIMGIDILPECANFEEPGIRVRIGSQDDPEFLRSVVEEMGGVDIVLDDGSHVAQHHRTSFETLFPLMNDGGVYVVEDLHTSYWRELGGAYGAPRGGFLEDVKYLIDDMHAWYHPKGEVLPVGAQQWVPRIAIYDSAVFITKRQKARPTNFISTGSR